VGTCWTFHLSYEQDPIEVDFRARKSQIEDSIPKYRYLSSPKRIWFRNSNLLSFRPSHPCSQSNITFSRTCIRSTSLPATDKACTIHANPLNNPIPAPFTMSSSNFSNANTGSKPADPYTAKNKDEPSLSEKVEDLSSFISACKFGMMTTHTKDSNLLVSRCMALAAKVRHPVTLIFSLR
jgi:hypothetical protein